MTRRHFKQHYEPAGVAALPVVLATVLFLAFVGLSLWALEAYFRSVVPGSVTLPPTAFPRPEPRPDLKTVRNDLMADQEKRLQGYAWMDRDAGIVRIPIERAMALIASRGEAAYAPIEAPGGAAPAGRTGP